MGKSEAPRLFHSTAFMRMTWIGVKGVTAAKLGGRRRLNGRNP